MTIIHKWILRCSTCINFVRVTRDTLSELWYQRICNADADSASGYCTFECYCTFDSLGIPCWSNQILDGHGQLRLSVEGRETDRLLIRYYRTKRKGVKHTILLVYDKNVI